MKTWSYQAITQKAEKEITSLMEESISKSDKFEKRLFQSWAYGAFCFWNTLTMGWQRDGDSDRLQALTRQE